jgi:hypothetical protein
VARSGRRHTKECRPVAFRALTRRLARLSSPRALYEYIQLGRAMTMTDHGTSTTVVKLPPGPGLPRAIQGVVAAANHRIALQILRRRYGAAFCRSSGTWLSSAIPVIFVSFSEPAPMSLTQPMPISAESWDRIRCSRCLVTDIVRNAIWTIGPPPLRRIPVDS